MTSTSTSRIAGIAICGALALSACGSDNNSKSSAGSTASSSPGTSSGPSSSASTSTTSGDCGKGSITAAGSSAQKNAMEEWIKNFTAKCSDASINYQPVGSGAGVQQFIAGSVAFAGSDSALKPDEHPQADKRCASGTALDLPMVVGPVAIMYNLSGVKDLVLDAPTIAKIFNNKITTWNDPAIMKLNPGAKLPSSRIQAFHRADESGTTDNVQKYLTAAAASDWTTGAGKKFTGAGGQSAKGSDGVTQAVKSTEGAITYVEASFAQNAGLGIAKIATGAAQPVELTSATAAKAVEAAKVSGTGDDLSLKLDYATKAEGAYPIVLVTYEIVCEKGTPADALPVVKSFLTYTSGEGQSVLEGLGYAPLPDSIRTKVASTVEKIS